MTMAPMAMTMLAADSEGNEGEKVAKLPCDTESQMPTPSSPQPHNCKVKGKTNDKVRKQTADEWIPSSFRPGRFFAHNDRPRLALNERNRSSRRPLQQAQLPSGCLGNCHGSHLSNSDMRVYSNYIYNKPITALLEIRAKIGLGPCWFCTVKLIMLNPEQTEMKLLPSP